MASEAISSSILLIGAVLGAAFLVTAILPAIFSAGDTFGTTSSMAENKIRTDFRIVNTFANDDTVKIWMKNVGASQISVNDVYKSDVFYGTSSSISRYTYSTSTPDPNEFTFTATLPAGNTYWDIGETLEIGMYHLTVPDDSLSFTFALPNSVRRAVTFGKTE